MEIPKNDRFNQLYQIKLVIDYTLLNVNEVMKLSIVEYFNYLSYCNAQILYENRKQRELQRKYKMK